MDDYKRLIQKAKINNDGAILLGKYVACDGFDWNCSVGVVTHAHGNHIQGLETSLGVYDQILTTEPTREILIAIKGDWLKFRMNLKPFPYRTQFKFIDEKIMLFPSKHMLGSAQVLVEDANGTRIVYTGDFFIPNTEPLEADVLVVDATCGDPSNVRKFTKECAIDYLVSLTKKLIKRSPVNIISSQGKIQEVMNYLVKEGIKAPFILQSKAYRVARVYEKYGISMGEYFHIEDPEAQEILKKQEPHVAFFTFGTNIDRTPLIKVSGYISNWNSKRPFCKISKEYWVVTISNHADFKGTLEYITRSKPKLVITDNHRSFGKAILLARKVRKKFGINAIALPQRIY